MQTNKLITYSSQIQKIVWNLLSSVMEGFNIRRITFYPQWNYLTSKWPDILQKLTYYSGLFRDDWSRNSNFGWAQQLTDKGTVLWTSAPVWIYIYGITLHSPTRFGACRGYQHDRYRGCITYWFRWRQLIRP